MCRLREKNATVQGLVYTAIDIDRVWFTYCLFFCAEIFRGVTSFDIYQSTVVVYTEASHWIIFNRYNKFNDPTTRANFRERLYISSIKEPIKHPRRKPTNTKTRREEKKLLRRVGLRGSKADRPLYNPCCTQYTRFLTRIYIYSHSRLFFSRERPFSAF